MRYAIIPAFCYRLLSEGGGRVKDPVYAVFSLEILQYLNGRDLLRRVDGLPRPDMIRYVTEGLVAWEFAPVIRRWAGVPSWIPLYNSGRMDPDVLDSPASLDTMIAGMRRDDGLDIDWTWVEVHRGDRMALAAEIHASGDVWRTNVFDPGDLL